MYPISSDEIAFENPGNFRIYKDGRIDRLVGNETIPPFTDPQTGVQSKDVLISPETGLSARIFLPRLPEPTRKLPLLVYFHGGAFCTYTPFSPVFHHHVRMLAATSEVIAVSVHYRRAPEHPLPVAFEDSWAAFEWALAHQGQPGSEPWCNRHADLDRVFVAGDSAGATLAHHVARRAGLTGLRIIGLVTIHPYFEKDGSNNPSKFLDLIFATRSESGDPRVNPVRDPNLWRLGCEKVLVCVAEKDHLRARGMAYFEALKKSGFPGNLEVFESEGEGHDFHLLNPSCDNAVAFMNKVVAFITNE